MSWSPPTSLPPQDSPALVTAADVAAALGLSRWRVYQLARRGELPGAVRLGRRLLFKRAVLERWLQGEEAGHE